MVGGWFCEDSCGLVEFEGLVCGGGGGAGGGEGEGGGILVAGEVALEGGEGGMGAAVDEVVVGESVGG